MSTNPKHDDGGFYTLKQCGTCVAFCDTAQHMGECRRKPPKADRVGDAVWPAVAKSDWCMAYEPFPAADDETTDSEEP